MKQLDLNGTWLATEDLGTQARAGKPGYVPNGWHQVRVPGHWQQVPAFEQFSGSLLYRRSFELTELPAPKEVACLRFAGIFSAAKVWCNGAFIGEHTGYFAPALYDVTRHLRIGENVVMVEVESPAEADPGDKRQIAGVFSHWEGKLPHQNPGGIWADVTLEFYPGLVPERFLVHAAPDQLPESPTTPEAGGFLPQAALADLTATVLCQLEYKALQEGQVSWRLVLTPETFEGESLELTGEQGARKGWNRLEAKAQLKAPRLWWTWDHGRPDLYRLTMEINLPGTTPLKLERLIGIRQVELRKQHLYLNGRRIFVRGTTYGPASLHLAAVGRERFARDLALMQDAHVNLVRVLAHVSKPELYEEASRRGILLWQDFPLHERYSRSVLDTAQRQAAAMVELLGAWPAVGIWCAHNAPNRYGDRDDASALQRSFSAISQVTGNWNSGTLAPAVKRAITGLDRTRPCLAHPGEWGTAQHIGWFEGKLRQLKKSVKSNPESIRFVTEFGAQSFPDAQASRVWVRGSWPQINWAELKAQRGLHARTIQRIFPPRETADSLPAYMEKTQAYQAHVIKYMVEHFRQRKYQPCGGAVQYLFTDGAPVISQSVIDFRGVEKPAYQALKAVYSPLYILMEWPEEEYRGGERITLPVMIINDAYESLTGAWTWRVEREGELLAQGGGEAAIGPDSLVMIPGGVDWPVPEGLPAGAVSIILTLTPPTGAPVVNRYEIETLALTKK